MAKCPNCKVEVKEPKKKWKYAKFTVKVYSCSNCGSQFRQYLKDGQHSFTLRLQKGSGFIRA